MKRSSADCADCSATQVALAADQGRGAGAGGGLGEGRERRQQLGDAVPVVDRQRHARAATGAEVGLWSRPSTAAPAPAGRAASTSGATSQSTRSARAISASARRTPSASARLSVVAQPRHVDEDHQPAAEIERHLAHVARGAGLVA